MESLLEPGWEKEGQKTEKVSTISEKSSTSVASSPKRGVRGVEGTSIEDLGVSCLVSAKVCASNPLRLKGRRKKMARSVQGEDPHRLEPGGGQLQGGGRIKAAFAKGREG